MKKLFSDPWRLTDTTPEAPVPTKGRIDPEQMDLDEDLKPRLGHVLRSASVCITVVGKNLHTLGDCILQLAKTLKELEASDREFSGQMEMANIHVVVAPELPKTTPTITGASTTFLETPPDISPRARISFIGLDFDPGMLQLARLLHRAKLRNSKNARALERGGILISWR